MSTLLLRIAAPMQSWGASSRFKKLSTEREPTKSGIIGLVASALGRDRGEDVSDLTALLFGVRVDQPGELLRDYHTAHNPNNNKLAFISERYYLCDAVFVVGLESDNDLLLVEIETALQSPRFPLYLGRRSCPPSGKIVLGISNLQLREALSEQEWQAQAWLMRRRIKEKRVNLEIIIDAPNDSNRSYIKRDIPVTFNQEHRIYGFRSISSDLAGVTVNNPLCSASDDTLKEDYLEEHQTEHDPFLNLGGE